MATFASADDITGRLGRALTTAEAAQTTTLLELATLRIAEAGDKDQEWADALAPVPAALRLICIELVKRALDNPTGALSVSETLGAYSHAERFDTSQTTGGLELSEPESRRIRRAIYGSSIAGVRVPTMMNQVERDWDGEVVIDDDIIADDVS